MARMCEQYMRDYALPFAVWEIRLYLNSHPNDRCALRLYHKLLAQAECGNYASIYLEDGNKCREDTASALDRMDTAACACYGNLDELMSDCNGCECQTGDSCPIAWSWVEDPWPWDGCCPNCAD